MTCQPITLLRSCNQVESSTGSPKVGRPIRRNEAGFLNLKLLYTNFGRKNTRANIVLNQLINHQKKDPDIQMMNLAHFMNTQGSNQQFRLLQIIFRLTLNPTSKKLIH